MLARFVLSTLCAGTLGATSAVCAQNYPTKPIRIVAGSIGGSNDQMARIIAQGIAGPIGQPVIVDNRGGLTSIDTVYKSAPDGYTILSAGSPFWITPLLQKLSYEPLRDFVPITITDQAANMLVVHPSVPAKSVRELIDLARSKPGVLNYSSGDPGSSSHLAAELFKSMAGVNVVRIPYSGTGPAIIALVSGEVQMIFASNASLTSNVKVGKLRALAIGSAQASTLMPDLPTIAATLPGYEAVGLGALLVRAKTPDAIVRRLNQEMVRALNSPDVRKKLALEQETEVVGSSPEEAAALIKADMARKGKLIKDIGLHAE